MVLHYSCTSGSLACRQYLSKVLKPGEDCCEFIDILPVINLLETTAQFTVYSLVK